MTVHVLNDVEVWADSLRLRGQMNSCALTDADELQEIPLFGDTGVRRLASGRRDPTLDIEGLYDPAVDAVLLTNVGLADVPVTVTPQGGAEGQRAYTFRASWGEYTPLKGAVGEPISFSLAAQGSSESRLVRGTLMHNAAETATGSGTIRNLGAVGATQKLYAALHVLDVQGGTLTARVQSDALASFLSPVTQITFADASVVGSQWAVPVLGPITDPEWRIDWTFAGTSVTFVVVIGIQ